MPSKINMLWSTDDRKWRPPLYWKSCRITFFIAASFRVYQKWRITRLFPKFYTSATGSFTPALATSTNVTKWLSDLNSQTCWPIPWNKFPSPCYVLPGGARVEQSIVTVREGSKRIHSKASTGNEGCKYKCCLFIHYFKFCGKGLKWVTQEKRGFLSKMRQNMCTRVSFPGIHWRPQTTESSTLIVQPLRLAKASPSWDCLLVSSSDLTTA